MTGAVLHVLEAEWQQTFLDLAHHLGWRHMHCRRSIGKGHRWTTATNVPWPDLTLWSERQRRLIFVELKSETGEFADGQEAVLDSLGRAGCEVYVWRPSDLPVAASVLAKRRAA